MTPFYIGKVEGEAAWLFGEEAQHCVKVMRMKPGDRVVGVDGAGHMLVGVIEGISRDVVTMRVVERHAAWGEKPQAVVLLVSPLHKPDRLEWLVEKAVELGVTAIVPYVGKHTVKTGLRIDRLERIMVAALKQSMRSQLPRIHEPVPFKAALTMLPEGPRLIGHAELGKPIDTYRPDFHAAAAASLLIGPEGDFAEEEVAAALAAGFKPVSLGTNRLRSETAAIHLLGLVKNLFGY